MSEPIISIEGLGKRYRIRRFQEGHQYVALRDVLAAKLAAPVRWWRGNGHRRFEHNEHFWALKDVDVDIFEGDVIGIIGRNGAGKSTLLKILSGITEPTEGRVTLNGRVASLLEVGTGFHPELTGRENIFLNGAILGMTRSEIGRKFDEIVAFAEVEKFLDTPVKRFSSGMYVRLAFAVAAHLEPEILIIDEVLAVGDAEFQKKCLGKMRAVATTDGRTVLFVSHNIHAIQTLCTRAVLLNAGRVQAAGPTAAVVGQYIAQDDSSSGERTWSMGEAPGDGNARLTAVRVRSNRHISAVASNRRPVLVELDFVANTTHPGLCVGFDLMNAEGITVLRTYQTDQAPDRWPPVRIGHNRWQCVIPSGFLNGGTYYVCPRISIHNVNWIVQLDSVLGFEMLLDHGSSPLWNSLDASNRPGLTAPILQWTCAQHESASEQFELNEAAPRKKRFA